MEKVKQLEEELAKEQSRLQAMISHLQVEGLEKDQKSASKTYLFSQPASNNRNLIGKRHVLHFMPSSSLTSLDEIYPRTVKDDPKYNVDIGFELSKKGDFYRTQDVRPPFTYAVLIKQEWYIIKIIAID